MSTARVLVRRYACAGNPASMDLARSILLLEGRPGAGRVLKDALRFLADCSPRPDVVDAARASRVRRQVDTL